MKIMKWTAQFDPVSNWRESEQKDHSSYGHDSRLDANMLLEIKFATKIFQNLQTLHHYFALKSSMSQKSLALLDTSGSRDVHSLEGGAGLQWQISPQLKSLRQNSILDRLPSTVSTLKRNCFPFIMPCT
jgi:hypothetical protein